MKQATLLHEVLGITNHHDVGTAFNESFMTLTGAPPTDEEIARSANDLVKNAPAGVFGEPHEIQDDLRDRTLASVTVRGILANTELVRTPLTDWPHYTDLMQNGPGEKSDGTASALMIGSQTAVSSRSFVCLAKTELGADEEKIHIVDPVDTKDKRRHGNFTQGSGFELPYDSDSMDFVVTNNLLYCLTSSVDLARAGLHDREPAFKRVAMIKKLSAEIGRVLAPGGQLLMKEIPIAGKGSKIQQRHLADSLEFGGIARPHLAPAANRWHDNAFLKDATRDFGNETKYPIAAGAVEHGAYVVHSIKTAKAVTRRRRFFW